MNINGKTNRNREITAAYFDLLDKHLADLISGATTEMLELNQIAEILCVSHKHLTDTVKRVTGHHPCHFFDQKILEEAKKLLSETDLPAADIARRLTYDPSNFSKFFKKYTGQTPGQYRAEHTK